MQLPSWAYLGIAIVVTFVWAFLNLLDPFLPGYRVDPQVDIVMGIVAGGFGIGSFVRRRQEDDDK